MPGKKWHNQLDKKGCDGLRLLSYGDKHRLQHQSEPCVGKGKNLTLTLPFSLKSFWGNQIVLVDERMFFLEEPHKCIGKEQLERYHGTAFDGILDSGCGCQWLKLLEGQKRCREMRSHLPHVHAHHNQT